MLFSSQDGLNMLMNDQLTDLVLFFAKMASGLFTGCVAAWWVYDGTNSSTGWKGPNPLLYLQRSAWDSGAELGFMPYNAVFKFRITLSDGTVIHEDQDYGGTATKLWYTLPSGWHYFESPGWTDDKLSTLDDRTEDWFDDQVYYERPADK